jgi:hypothetical protein
MRPAAKLYLLNSQNSSITVGVVSKTVLYKFGRS